MAELNDIAGNVQVYTATEADTLLTAKQETLISATNIKTINGATLLGAGDLVVGGASGVCGISDSLGVYTYYATLTLAMAAAVSGQVVELFADIVETGIVEISFKDGVNINGNGHTYAKNTNDATPAFIHPQNGGFSITSEIFALKIIRSVGNGIAIHIINGANGNLNFTGCIIKNTGANWVLLVDGNTTVNITGGTYYGVGVRIGSGKAFNITCFGSSVGIFLTLADLHNSFGYSDNGTGIHQEAGTAINCEGRSVSDTGFYSSAVTINCVGLSISGMGFDVPLATNVLGCSGFSTSGIGINNISLNIYNCIAISSSNFAARLTGGTMYGTLAKSSTMITIRGRSGSNIYGSTIICAWNNADGHGILGQDGFISPIIVNCLFLLANTSAPYLFNDGVAQAISMANNTYKGGAAFNANLTQAIVNTADNQGNIYL